MRIQQTLRCRLWPILLMACIGCGDSRLPVSGTPGKEPPTGDIGDRVTSSAAAVKSATGASSPPAASERSAVSAADSSRAGSAQRPSFIHPIDRLAEGSTYRAAIAALDAGDLVSAEKLRAQLASHPQYGVLADAIAGFALVKQGRPKEAIAVAEQVSKIPVMQAEAYLIAGEAFHSQRLWADAIGAFRGALETHPDHVRAHRWLGAILYDTGAMWEAVKHLRTVADLDAQDYRVLRLSGLIHYDYQQYDEAVEDYRRALQRPLPEPMEIEVRLELADSLRELRKHDEALAVLQACPPSAAVHAMRAVCYESAGEEAKAFASAQRALELEPRHPRANLAAGRLQLARREWTEAVEHLKIAVEADPTAHEPRFLLGRALLQAGQRELGQAELDQSTKLKEMALELAELHIEAIAKPADAALRMRMGRLAERLGRQRAALTWYRAALGLDPELSEASEAIKRLSQPAA